MKQIGAKGARLPLGDADLHMKDMHVLHCGKVTHPDAMPGQNILKLIGHGGAAPAWLASKKRLCRMGISPSNILRQTREFPRSTIS